MTNLALKGRKHLAQGIALRYQCWLLYIVEIRAFDLYPSPVSKYSFVSHAASHISFHLRVFLVYCY